jgi:hypothetical protein
MFLATAVEQSFAQARWPSGFLAPFNYYSTDLALVELTLRNPSDHDPRHQRILHVPRAAFVFVNGFEPKQTPRLPDKIESNEVELALTYPDGRPLSAHAAEIAATEKRNSAAAVQSLQARQYIVHLHYTAPSNPWEARTREMALSLNKYTDVYDGLRHGPADNYLGEEGVDEFVKMLCYPEATPKYLCTVDMRVGVDLVAVARFPDFRFHGGRAYVNDRVRKLRDALCRYATVGGIRPIGRFYKAPPQRASCMIE